jgi:AraC-like DNA-binding protein
LRQLDITCRKLPIEQVRMKLELLGEPLGRYPAFRTSDLDEFGSALTSVYGATSYEIPSPEDFAGFGNFVQLQDIAIGFSSLGGRERVEFPETDYARLQIAHAGSGATRIGGVTTDINAAQSCITSPGQPATISYGEGFEQLHLRISTDALQRALTALLGRTATVPLQFAAAVNGDSPQVHNLHQLIVFLCGQLNSPVPLPPLVLEELQHATTLLFLTAYPHNYTRFMERDGPAAAPRHVRLIEDYIKANWNQPITIEQLMSLTDISARGIFKAFQRSRGYSPMAFAKRVRIEHARTMLADTDTTTTVTAVAFACGFANLGHFAKDYRQMFGEKPSATLERSRRSR